MIAIINSCFLHTTCIIRSFLRKAFKFRGGDYRKLNDGVNLRGLDFVVGSQFDQTESEVDAIFITSLPSEVCFSVYRNPAVIVCMNYRKIPKIPMK